jgi:hypothetical protein
MTPFEIIPGWRIVTTDREFTLEYLQTPKKKGSTKCSWRAAGHFGHIEHAVEAYVSEALRKSREPLPEVLAQVQAQIKSIMAQIRGVEPKADRTGEPA